MKVMIHIENRNRSYYAEGIYSQEGIIVKKGGKISDFFAEYIRGGKKAMEYRSNREYVDAQGIIVKDCIFKSPSTAAQFVTGRSVNGYNIWKVVDGKTLGNYLQEQGLR